MNRTLLIVPLALLTSSVSIVPSAFASVTPTLSVIATGSSDSVQVSVTGDPYASVLLSYTQIGSGPVVTSLGSTNASGFFSTVISTANYNLTSGTAVTAIVGGTSGPHSPTVAWPTVVATSNTLTLNQNAVVVAAGSSATLTASNLVGSSALYVSNNSNSSIANVSISGTQVTVSGNTAGSTSLTVCQVGNTTNCPSVYVMVTSAGAAQLSLSQNSVSVVSGQNLPVTMSGGTGVYQILNNSNPTVIQASISGSVLTISTGSTSGSASITVCSSDRAMCGVVVATAGSSSSTAVSFSSSAPIVSVNQSTPVTVYGPAGVQYYVSANSNPAVVQANLSGSLLTLTGVAAGSSSVTVCATTGACSSLTVTVQSVVASTNIALSQNTVSLLAGQNIAITVSGGTQPYAVSGGVNTVAQQTLSGSILTVYGIAGGVSSVNVCSAAGGCTLLTVTVNSSASTPVVTTTPSTSTSVATTLPAYTFTKYLALGSTGTEVTELQNVLVRQGLLLVAPNGYFGAQTKAAVIKLQAAHSLAQLGVVGPSTRAVLNQLATTSVISSTATAVSAMTIAQLREHVLKLQAELSETLARISQLAG